jgi:hypothetical protein
MVLMSSFPKTVMYDPTTPGVKRPVKSSKANGRSAAVAGPSSKPIVIDANGATANESDESAIEAEVVQRNRSKPKRAASREPHNATKSRSTQRSKGKEKPRSPSSAVAVDEPTEAAETGEDVIQAAAFALGHNSRRMRDNENSASWKKQEEKHRKDIERLEGKLKDVCNQHSMRRQVHLEI